MPVWYREEPDENGDAVEIFRGTVWEMAKALDAAKGEIKHLQGLYRDCTMGGIAKDQETEQSHEALEHEHDKRIEAAVEGSRYKASLLLERQNVRLLHDATIILGRALLTGDPTGRQDAYREATALIDQVSDAVTQIAKRTTHA